MHGTQAFNLSSITQVSRTVPGLVDISGRSASLEGVGGEEESIWVREWWMDEEDWKCGQDVMYERK